MSARLFSRPARVLAAAGVAVVGLVLVAGPASAHVTVGADDNHQGASDSVLTFRVPNEEDAATTVKVVVTFPTKDPLPSVKPGPKPGWTVTTKTVTFATPIKTDDGTLTSGVGQVTWTAKSAADGIPVGGFDSFTVLVGPLPDQATELAFPTTQTYSDGKTVAWIEPTPAGGTAPEHPAPVLALAPAAAGSDAGTSASPTASADAGAAGASAAATPAASAAADAPAVSAASTGEFASKSDVSTGRTLGLVGLVLGALGLLVGGAAFARSGRGKG